MAMEFQTITVYTPKDFRKWLKKNHKKESKVCVVVHKRHTGKPAPSHRELMNEAICFGWIDTTIKRLDDHTFARYFVKRNTNSRWSDNTISYAKELIRQRSMAPQGMHFYKLGLAKPTHDHGIPKNPDMPEDLKSALAKSKTAAKNFESYTPSSKRMLFRWILRAKLPLTRKNRIARIVALAKKGTKPTW